MVYRYLSSITGVYRYEIATRRLRSAICTLLCFASFALGPSEASTLRFGTPERHHIQYFNIDKSLAVYII